MQKLRSNRRKSHFKQRLLLAAVLVTAIGASGVSIYWHTATTNEKIATIRAESAAQIAKDDAKIIEIKARKAAELKAKQEAAAKKAADQAISADASTASLINSSDCNFETTHNNPASIDVVVNKKHCIQPVGYVPNDLVDVGGGFLLSAKAADSFNAMMNAASGANEPIALTSSYRSYSNQVSTYAYWVNVSGADGADTYSARPGYSEHQTGLAFDVADAAKHYVLSDFAKTSQYAWLQAHAADYGFIQRYYAGYEAITGYSAEEWHYRYVGVDVAQDMKAKNIKTLEQYWNISGGTY